MCWILHFTALLRFPPLFIWQWTRVRCRNVWEAFFNFDWINQSKLWGYIEKRKNHLEAQNITLLIAEYNLREERMVKLQPKELWGKNHHSLTLKSVTVSNTTNQLRTGTVQRRYDHPSFALSSNSIMTTFARNVRGIMISLCLASWSLLDPMPLQYTKSRIQWRLFGCWLCYKHLYRLLRERFPLLCVDCLGC